MKRTQCKPRFKVGERVQVLTLVRWPGGPKQGVILSRPERKTGYYSIELDDKHGTQGSPFIEVEETELAAVTA